MLVIYIGDARIRSLLESTKTEASNLEQMQT
jgi:hypothetical protein